MKKDGKIKYYSDIALLFRSNYGVENVTYVIIDYVAVKEYWKLFVGTVREVVAAHTEVIKVLDLTEIGGYVGTSIGSFNAAVLAQGDFDKLYQV